MTGLYVHIPFCKEKCAYCDFFSFKGKEVLIPSYMEALNKEIKSHKEDHVPWDTLYIGGGTPSILEIELLEGLFSNLYSSLIKSSLQEVTIEVNPGTVSLEKLRTYYALGINRLSIGAQSFNPYQLKQLGRIHNLEEIKATVKWAKAAGFKNISIDLMYGLPEQSLADLQADVQEALALDVPHISYYGLIIEPGTPFYNRWDQDLLCLPEEDEVLGMGQYIRDTLRKNGLERYEISNYSRPGYESLHNLIYWNRGNYLALGANGSSFINGVRWQNQNDLTTYIEDGLQGVFKRLDVHKIEYKEALFEAVMLGLRLIKGFDIDEFNKRYKIDIWDHYRKPFEFLENEGLLTVENKHVFLTERGLDVSNQCLEMFLP